MNRRNCYILKPNIDLTTNIENYFNISKAGIRLGSKIRSRMDKNDNKRLNYYGRIIKRSELNIDFNRNDINRKEIKKRTLKLRITMISKIPMLVCGEALD